MQALIHLSAGRTFRHLLGISMLLPLLHGRMVAQSFPAGGGSGAGFTLSIVAWDSLTGDIGVAVQSDLPSSGAFVPSARAGLGAVASQGQPPDAGLASIALDLLGKGFDARQTVESITRSDSGTGNRQLGVVDASGNAFAYTGARCGQFAGQVSGRGYTVQALRVPGEEPVKAAARMFEVTPGDLAERLMAAMESASALLRNHGQSASLLVVREGVGFGGSGDRLIDIRVDDDSVPVASLKRIYRRWAATVLPDVRIRSIDLFNQKRKFEAAQEEMRRMVSSFNEEIRNRPDDAEVLNRVARALATHDIDRERALELAKRAAALSPGTSYILDTVAECQYRLGRYDEAVAIETELVTREPGNDDYWKQLQKFKEAKQRGGR